ncbi:MAG: response regulator [Nocardioides sp.]|nr:response regulator [Nocardioides sp.]
MELGVGALVVAAVVGHAIIDSSVVAVLIYLGVLCGASVVAWVGAESGPVSHRLVGRLIAAGLSLNALGDVLWEVLDRSGAATDVSIADPPWFASYVLLGTAMWVVLRRGNEGSRDDLAFAIDAATVVVVSVLIFWSVSIETIVADKSLAPHVRIVWASYPVADAVLLALVVRVLMSRRARAALHPSFAVGVCLWLAADVAYLQSPDGSSQIMMDAAWMIAPVLLARSAWRVATPSTTVAPAASSGPVAQLVVAVVPLLVPPALEIVADMRGEPDKPLLLLTGTTLLTLLAFVRTARLMRSEERAHRELEGALDAALEASRTKSMFLATMSHEIRTPLTLVLGAGELLEDTSLDEFQLGLVRRMRRSGHLLKGLVDGVLDLSRVEAGQLEIVSTPFSLHRVVDDLADVYQTSAAEAGVGFDHRWEPGVPSTVVGDPERLIQVLGNLLDNALKFTPEGRVSLVVRPVPTARDVTDARADGVVEFVVSDTGIGISPEDLPRVFESFRQVDGSSTRRYGGTGLGLAICTQLTELMGGHLTATSELGHGSVFVARLPLGPTDEEIGTAPSLAPLAGDPVPDVGTVTESPTRADVVRRAP